MNRVRIPRKYCIYQRDLWFTYVAFYGIRVWDQFMIYRDFETGEYIVAQE